jgi:hypothetical protein
VKITRALWAAPLAALAPLGSAIAAGTTPTPPPSATAAEAAFTVVDVGAPKPSQAMIAGYGVPELLDVEASMTDWGFAVGGGFPLVGNALLYHLSNRYTTGALEQLSGQSSHEARFVVTATAADLQRVIDAVEAALPIADRSVMDRSVSSGNDDGVEYLIVELSSPYNSREPSWEVQVSTDTEDSPDAVSIIISRYDYRLDTTLPLAPRLLVDFGDEIATAAAAGLGEPVGATISIGASFGFVSSSFSLEFLFNGPADAAGNAACGAFQLTAAPSEYSDGAFDCERRDGSTPVEIRARPNYSDETFTNIVMRFTP